MQEMGKNCGVCGESADLFISTPAQNRNLATKKHGKYKFPVFVNYMDPAL